VRFTLLAARIKGQVKHTDWIASLNSTNERLQRTRSV
jgi:hypothetical protein